MIRKTISRFTSGRRTRPVAEDGRSRRRIGQDRAVSTPRLLTGARLLVPRRDDQRLVVHAAISTRPAAGADLGVLDTWAMLQAVPTTSHSHTGQL